MSTPDLVYISTGAVILQGDLALPPGARGIVLFAHGSGSSRHSPRNRFVAEVLQAGGFATLLIDLLTSEEEHADALDAHLRFDIPLLAVRLSSATDWLAADPRTNSLPLGYFGASTGAAAALLAASQRPSLVRAIVSRGGRPDLADAALPGVQAPTLLLVGERDEPVIAMNRDAMARMRSTVELEIIPAATHLFPEPGALEAVAERACAWFARYLPPAPASPAPSSSLPAM